MKRICVLFITVVFFTLTAACGIQEPGSPTDSTDTSTSADDHTVDIDVDVTIDDQTSDDPSEDPVDDPVDDPVEDPVVEEPEYLPAPFRLAAVEQDGVEGWRFAFSQYYISDAPCGEARGSWPGVDMGWGTDKGFVLTDGGDGYLHFDLFGDDVVDGSVVLSYIQGESCGDNQNGWAQYGSVDQLTLMAPEAREWIYCGWADGGDGSDTCNIRFTVTEGVVPAGNMEDFQR